MRFKRIYLAVLVVAVMFSACAVGASANGLGAGGFGADFSYDYIDYLKTMYGILPGSAGRIGVNRADEPAEVGAGAEVVIAADAVGAAEIDADGDTGGNVEAIGSDVPGLAQAVFSGLSGGPSPVFINVTKPGGEGAEIVYKETYSICGVRDDEADPYEPLVLLLTRYSEDLGGYVAFRDVDGEDIWTVGVNGVFTRSVVLAEGWNNFAIAVCKASAIEASIQEGRDVGAEDIQIVEFAIVYRAQNVTEMISGVIKDLSLEKILKEIDNH